jgi:hypothetical protein
MYRILAIGTLIIAAGELQASECDALGVAEPELAAGLCAELRALGGTSETGRGFGTTTPNEDDRPGLEEWADIDLIQDAYRADPRKTLELIRRIKDAGGLATE